MRWSRAESETMTVDESFKKPGAVPFKWEIRPGVPKIQTDRRRHHRPHRKHQQRDQEDEEAVCKECPLPPLKLKPPSGYRFFPPEEPPSRSFRYAPRARLERWSVGLPMLAQPVCVSQGCFPMSPSFKQKEKRSVAYEPGAKPEPNNLLDTNRSTRRPASTRKPVSPFQRSPSSSYSSLQSSPRLLISSPRLSISSCQLSPQPAQDPDWASFGLF